jgi:hypothetical protein
MSIPKNIRNFAVDSIAGHFPYQQRQAIKCRLEGILAVYRALDIKILHLLLEYSSPEPIEEHITNMEIVYAENHRQGMVDDNGLKEALDRLIREADRKRRG